MKNLLLLNTVSQKDEKPHTVGLNDTSILHLHLSRTLKSKWPKYCLKKSSIPQKYRKPSCPPQHNAHSENRHQKRREVIACKKLKTMENHFPSGPKSGRSCLQEVVIYLRFQLWGFDWENFGFLAWSTVTYGRWLHTRFSCIRKQFHLSLEFNIWLQLALGDTF